MIRRTLAAALALGLGLSVAGAARAEPLGSYQEHWGAQLGVRTTFVKSAGFDPYADDDALVESSIGFGRTVLSDGPLSLAVLGFWEFGERRAEARGAATSLGVNHLALGAEARYHLLPPLYGFVRAAPSVTHVSASLEDPVANTTLSSRSWLLGWDVSAGGAFQVFGKKSPASSHVRFWILAEGGYTWTGSTDVQLTSESDDPATPARSAPVALPALALRGGTFRIAGVLTF
ncbi:MAG: hypothetical protein OZ921_09350 [Sorangiineae bacterium]|nr:hypothetical protein [Polyangiaceae bacterium]MEB2322709.1 hypothetical protein [Sorangiineae bacterium]